MLGSDNSCGICRIFRTPATSWLRNLPRSALLNRERRTLAICTRQERASGERLAGRAKYRSKKSWRVEYSRKAGRQAVGI